MSSKWRIPVGIKLAATTIAVLVVVSTALFVYLSGHARAQLVSTANLERTLELLDWPFAAALSTVLLVAVLILVLLAGRIGRVAPA